MKRRYAALFMAALMAGAVLTGCGSDDTSDASSSSDEDTVSASDILEATEYDIQDYVELGDYTSISVELEDVYEVTDEDIEGYAEYLIALYPAYEATDKTVVEEGDLVNIDYVGTLDGEEFDGGSDEGYRLEIGSDTFIDGFEDGLIGVSVGETVDLELTFPDDYSSEDLAGQDVVFTVTVNSIDEEIEMAYEDITDEYVYENFASSGIETVDEFIEELESMLESSYESSYSSDIVDAATQALLEASNVEMPEGLLEERVEEYYLEELEYAESLDMDFDEYLEEYYGYTEDEYMEDLETYMEDSILEQLIYEALVYTMDVSISLADFEEWIDYYVDYYSYDDTESFYEDNGGEEYMMLIYAENQALNAFVDMVDVTLVESDDSGSEE